MEICQNIHDKYCGDESKQEWRIGNVSGFKTED